ncbi:hypothetical protein B0A50_08054 [Salinomyces thailandicus]|uniref:Uncharacterized protein n=1 Tax=Salinomyces thailandicus TaxID=706561 RepID=A0A4V5N354_9PEZI|nr:hypothetical protein B0A50_08054 [Salinomyces thailandica]
MDAAAAWYFTTHETYTDFYALPDSWVEISSQPSSSSLSSTNDEVPTTGLRIQHDPRQRRRRTLRPGAPSQLNVTSRAPSTSSQDEYEESESEEDRVLSSSGEGVAMPIQHGLGRNPLGGDSSPSDGVPEQMSDDDENRTAVNYPIRNPTSFTPQPNAFSHPPTSGSLRNASQPNSDSYFPATARSAAPRRPPATRPSLNPRTSTPSHHLPQNILSPSYTAAAQHDEALRASLSTLLSCAAAARGLSKADQKRPQPGTTAQIPNQRGNRVEPMSFRLIPESAAPVNHSITHTHNYNPHLQDPSFPPTIRRRPSTETSVSTSSFSSNNNNNNNNNGNNNQHTTDPKRKSPSPRRPRTRSSSRNNNSRRAQKKPRRSSGTTPSHSPATNSDDDLAVTPTLLTWVVSAGVVLFFSAVSFRAGYSLGCSSGGSSSSGSGSRETFSSTEGLSRLVLGGGAAGGGGGGGGTGGLMGYEDAGALGVCAKEVSGVGSGAGVGVGGVGVGGLGFRRGLARSAAQV